MVAPPRRRPLDATISTADSLIGSLCRESDNLRQQMAQLQSASQRCRSTALAARLQQELDGLAERRRQLRNLARDWQRQPRCDRLAVAFLLELCERGPAVEP
ncbi:MAG: hypothetical protein VKI83_03320 [Synechococcaceae cyanobacterium]|nr:hypothetical protein [Synechococcaceae cyanobacterium]